MTRPVSAPYPVRLGESLADHTTWRVGGPADLFFMPTSVDCLADFLAQRPEGPLFWLGLGSNVLVRDGGIRGTTVATVGGLAGLRATEDGVIAEAGVPLAKLARLSVAWGYTGLEFLAGIPGTVGGALAMNAGAAGGETWNSVVSVDTVDAQGRLRSRTPAEFAITYRCVKGPVDEFFVAARFRLATGEREAGKRLIKEHLAVRNRTQPVQTANAGSVFCNPPGDFAARLIEAVGLKGLRVGGACVSARHANFIINDATARAADIEYLIQRVRTAVHETTGVLLETEIRIVGEPE